MYMFAGSLSNSHFLPHYMNFSKILVTAFDLLKITRQSQHCKHFLWNQSPVEESTSAVVKSQRKRILGMLFLVLRTYK